MLYLTLMLQLGCITSEIEKSPGDFPDNQSDDYDNDGLSEFDGDCDDLNQNVQGPSLWYVDSDGDGFGNPLTEVEACQSDLLDLEDVYVAEGTDCDDENPEIHPDATESCDGIDNDCDQLIDNNNGTDAPLWYYDDDNDGFGDLAVSLHACSAPAGHVGNGTDCDDSNADAYPNAPEYCDGVDTNCNGIEDDNSAQDAALWYQDGDADGHGSTVSQASCSQPSGYVAETGDCNDNNAAVYPGADEYCNSVDDDCDGQTDELGAVDAPTWYADLDGDGFGNAVVTEQTCVASPGYVVTNTDCDDGDSAVFPNADELCNNGKDDDCDGQQDESDAVDPLAWYADSDTDGYGDPLQIAYACLAPSGHVDNNDDCDDSDAAVSPDANEICDSLSPIDNDCDGLIDDFDLSLDPTTGIAFYADSDQDGFGNAFDEVFACSQPLGYVENNTDCDDGDPLQRPGGVEYCNSADDDCDGQVDEEDAVDRWEFFYDGDQDGHGIPDPSLMLSSCPQPGGEYLAPTGYSLLDDDCNDAESGISPSADELCTDTIDEDCDGDTTFAAVDFQTWYADNDGDGQGNALYAIDLCTQPFGYVSNSDDCNDTDPDVLSGMPESWELCNGKLDRCEDDDGSLTPPEIEIDDDEDGFVDCALDVDPLQWADQTAGILGGGDCEDDDQDAYPGAAEKCNGVVEDFRGDALCDEALPDNESDDDFDGFVECNGYDLQPWEGDVSVVGGDDCQDGSDLTYPGAAVNSPGVCAQDLDNDGNPDCNLTGIHPDYVCDNGIFPSVGVGPDLVLIPAGSDPDGRYSISFDFFMMTTELTESMWDSFMGSGSNAFLLPKTGTSWHGAAVLANAMSVFSGKEECYNCNGGICSDLVSPITDCMGYRLPTQFEWEYAARSGTTGDFWTGDGFWLGGNVNDWDGCSGNETINSPGSPLLGDYAWYCGNNNPSGLKSVAQKLPNGFGLYDMHGNAREWTADSKGPFNPSGIDPYYPGGSSGSIRGGYYDGKPRYARVTYSMGGTYTNLDTRTGFRLVIRAP